MVKPVFYGWNFVCPVCGRVTPEGVSACFTCGEPFDWSEGPEDIIRELCERSELPLDELEAWAKEA